MGFPILQIPVDSWQGFHTQLWVLGQVVTAWHRISTLFWRGGASC